MFPFSLIQTVFASLFIRPTFMRSASNILTAWEVPEGNKYIPNILIFGRCIPYLVLDLSLRIIPLECTWKAPYVLWCAWFVRLISHLNTVINLSTSYTTLLLQADGIPENMKKTGVAAFDTWTLVPTVVAAPSVGIITPQQSNNDDCGVRSQTLFCLHFPSARFHVLSIIAFDVKNRFLCAHTCISSASDFDFDLKPQVFR